MTVEAVVLLLVFAATLQISLFVGLHRADRRAALAGAQVAPRPSTGPVDGAAGGPS